MTGISQREFARREKCTPKLVRNRLERGYLKANADGTIDPALVGTGWRKANADRIERAKAIVAKAPVTPPKAESEARKEHYLAELKKIELDQAKAKLLPADEVKRAVAAAFGRVRAKLLAIPSKAAPVLARKMEPAQAFAIVQEHIYEALTELAGTKIGD
jgi:hypothetical protein